MDYTTVRWLTQIVNEFDPNEPLRFTVWSNPLYPQPQLALEGKSKLTGNNLMAHLPLIDAQERVVVSG